MNIKKNETLSVVGFAGMIRLGLLDGVIARTEEAIEARRRLVAEVDGRVREIISPADDPAGLGV